MKKMYLKPDYLKIQINATESFSSDYVNCLPYMWGGELQGTCETPEGVAMQGYSYAECVEVGYPT